MANKDKEDKKELTGSEEVQALIDELHNYRDRAMQKDSDNAEEDPGNLVYKKFRDLGYLDNLTTLRDALKDEELSVEEINETLDKKPTWEVVSRDPVNEKHTWYYITLKDTSGVLPFDGILPHLYVDIVNDKNQIGGMIDAESHDKLFNYIWEHFSKEDATEICQDAVRTAVKWCEDNNIYPGADYSLAYTFKGDDTDEGLTEAILASSPDSLIELVDKEKNNSSWFGKAWHNLCVECSDFLHKVKDTGDKETLQAIYNRVNKENYKTATSFEIDFENILISINNIKKELYTSETTTKTEDLHTIEEDTKKKKNGKWVNKGKEGEHGEFKTKKAADAQRKAMFANGYTAESLDDPDEVDEVAVDTLDAGVMLKNIDKDFKSTAEYEKQEIIKDIQNRWEEKTDESGCINIEDAIEGVEDAIADYTKGEKTVTKKTAESYRDKQISKTGLLKYKVSEMFDTTTTGDEYYDKMLNNPRYARLKEGKEVKIIEMTPREFLTICAGDTPVDEYIDQLSNDILTESHSRIVEGNGGPEEFKLKATVHHTGEGATTFAIFSADNPELKSEDDSIPTDNASRAKALYADLDRLGNDYIKVEGYYGGLPEQSVVVYNILYLDTEELAEKYGQGSFFWGDSSGIKLYVWNGETYDCVELTHIVIDADDFDDLYTKYKDYKFHIYTEYFDGDLDEFLVAHHIDREDIDEGLVEAKKKKKKKKYSLPVLHYAGIPLHILGKHDMCKAGHKCGMDTKCPVMTVTDAGEAGVGEAGTSAAACIGEELDVETQEDYTYFTTYADGTVVKTTDVDGWCDALRYDPEHKGIKNIGKIIKRPDGTETRHIAWEANIGKENTLYYVIAADGDSSEPYKRKEYAVGEAEEEIWNGEPRPIIVISEYYDEDCVSHQEQVWPEKKNSSGPKTEELKKK